MVNSKTNDPVKNSIQQKLKSTVGNDNRCGECYNKLVSLNKGNGDILINYVLEYKHETDVKDSTLTTNLLYLLRFAQKVKKPFADMTREDIIGYLNGIKIGNKWRRTFKLLCIYLTRFFRWFYHPGLSPKERNETKPRVVENLGKVKIDTKKDRSYKHTDMWTLENQNIFFKYCPSKKIKCYHAIAVDTGARPHEILGLKIEDIIWPPDGRPPTFTVSGKTGSRPLPLLRFHRYVREWIEQHPKRAVPSSILILSKRGGMLNGGSLREYYVRVLKPYFANLLNEAIGQEDRNQIQEMLKKPWNPYILRHSTATELLGRRNLNTDLAKQFFGWSENSNMPSIYENFDGHEAIEVLSEKFGLKPQTKQEFLPRLRECPNVICKELNAPDAPFCVKCRVPLTVAGYMEQGPRKDREISELRERMDSMQKCYEDLAKTVFNDLKTRIHDREDEMERKQKAEDERRRILYSILDKRLPGWDKEYHELLAPKPLTPGTQDG